MLAARFILIAYGIACLAAFATAGQIGALRAVVLAWSGGALLTLVLAFGWYYAVDWLDARRRSRGDAGEPAALKREASAGSRQIGGAAGRPRRRESVDARR